MLKPPQKQGMLLSCKDSSKCSSTFSITISSNVATETAYKNAHRARLKYSAPTHFHTQKMQHPPSPFGNWVLLFHPEKNDTHTSAKN